MGLLARHPDKCLPHECNVVLSLTLWLVVVIIYGMLFTHAYQWRGGELNPGLSTDNTEYYPLHHVPIPLHHAPMRR